MYGQVCETIVGGGGCAFAHGAEVGARRPHRCGQPGQQHGRRIPSFSSEHTLSTCWRLVSSFFTEMVQQIHSLRASGVRSSQAVNTFASDARAFRRSAGRSCTTPWEIRLVVIGLSRGLNDQESGPPGQRGCRAHGERMFFYHKVRRCCFLSYYSLDGDSPARYAALRCCGQEQEEGAGMRSPVSCNEGCLELGDRCSSETDLRA